MKRQKSAIGYIRQLEDGVDEQYQLLRMQKWCKDNGVKLRHAYMEDEISSRSLFSKAVLHANKLNAVLLIQSPLHACDDFSEAVDILNDVDNVVSMDGFIDTSTACGKALFRMCVAMHDYEHDVVQEMFDKRRRKT